MNTATPTPSPNMDASSQAWERTYATWTHLTMLAMLFLGIPVVGALIMWIIKKDQSAFINDQGKEATNFQISCFIYMIASGLLAMVVVGFFLFPAVWIFAIVCSILASLAAGRGELYRYPMCIRLIK